MPCVENADYHRLSQFSARRAELAKMDSWKSMDKLYYRFIIYIYIYSSLRPWGIVRSSIFTSSYHHPPYPFFTIIFHPPYHQEKSHPSTHFMHPSSYHSSTPFFHPFILSFFVSIFLIIIFLIKKFPHHSFFTIISSLFELCPKVSHRI